MFSEKFNGGKALREKTTRTSQGLWTTPIERPSVESMILQSNHDRIPELIPVRHYRMSKSPFTFYRATASIMARDLSCKPSTGIIVQACGDCHIMNFGGYATPESSFLFDINDFDETNPAPWEWDLKRLATSFILACREKNISEQDANDVVAGLINAYTDKINEFASMNFLDLWYSKFTLQEAIRYEKTNEGKRMVARQIQNAQEKSQDKNLYKISAGKPGQIKIANQDSLVYHPLSMEGSMKNIHSFMDQYKSTLQNDRKTLLDHYEVMDVALKVVGVGSVGTRCFVVLLMNDNKEPLFLQVKEARQSVLEPFSHKSKFSHAGERIVYGQRLIHAATDMFLGWATDIEGRHFYLRQLRDKKLSPEVDEFNKSTLAGYGVICGGILARAHCKTGNGPYISGYIGKGESFTEAIGKFALAYADQTEKDYYDFMKAVNAGRLPVEMTDER